MFQGLKAKPTIETASDFVNNLNASMALVISLERFWNPPFHSTNPSVPASRLLMNKKESVTGSGTNFEQIHGNGQFREFRRKRFDKVLTSIQQFLLAIAIWGGDFATSIWLD
jgi:hypothetical protein